MNSEIENYLNKLKGIKIRDIKRTDAMIWLNLGDTIMLKEDSGEEIENGPLCLHIQCLCRMLDIEKRKVLFTSSDIFQPNSSIKWSDNFDWDIQGNNLFDEKVLIWLSSNSEVTIIDYKFNIFRDLRLTLSNGNIFEITVDSTYNEECWRLFERFSNKAHFVVTGQEIIFECE